MSKYKVGDKVRIRSKLKIGEKYGGLELLSCMADFKGKMLTVKEVNATRLYGNCYTFEEDNKNILGLRFLFSEEMLEPVEKENNMSSFDWEAFKTKKIAVHCDTEEKAKAFLEECDKHNIKWNDITVAANHTNWKVYRSRTCYNYHNARLAYAGRSCYESEDFKIIECPFVESAKYPEIHITTDGKTTTAVKMLNGKEIARGIARCHPDDKFDFDMGAYVALEHLNHPFKPRLENIRYPNRWYGFIGEKISATTVSGEPIHIGDTVEIYNSALERTYRVFIHGRTAEGGTEVFIGHSSEAEYKNGCNKLQDIIVKITKPYTELKNGEMIGNEIKAVTK